LIITEAENPRLARVFSLSLPKKSLFPDAPKVFASNTNPAFLDITLDISPHLATLDSQDNIICVWNVF
jgi:hypothetical protein